MTAPELLLEPALLTPLVPHLSFGEFVRFVRALGRCAKDVAAIPELGAHFSARLYLRRAYAVSELAALVRSSPRRCANCALLTNGAMLHPGRRIVCRACASDPKSYHLMLDRRSIRTLLAHALFEEPAARRRELRARVVELFGSPDRVTTANRYLYFATRAERALA